MNWLRSHKRAVLLVGVTLVIPAYLYLSVLLTLFGAGLDYRAERHRLESRLARVQGLLLKRSELAEHSAIAASTVRDQAYPGSEAPSALAASLQAEARQIFSEAGLAVSNSQVQPLRRGETFDQVAVKIVVSGSVGALDSALVGIAAHRPKLLIESLDVFPQNSAGRRAGDDARSLTAAIQLMALRIAP